MATPYLGEIRAVGFTFAPVGWALCNGQALNIAQNQALFTLLGTTYGGDGTTIFNLPDLRSRVAAGAQGGPGLTSYALGQTGGQENVLPTANQLPAHTHPFSAALAASTGGTLSDDPAGRLPGSLPNTYQTQASAGQTLAASAVTGSTSPAGGGQAHPNLQPVLALTYILCTEGLFPPKP